SKTKLYCALVWLAAPLDAQRLEEINQQGALVLQQKTPVRVLHRRAPLTRAKRVLRLELVHLEGRFYKLRVEAEAGTYIKEFVHGDLGRTVPSLAQMAGVPADILELDVENVSLDFPPPLPSS
ncbi:putative tRNA pseudouridine synthase Pus10, partial [Coemansia sp. RSA 2611]